MSELENNNGWTEWSRYVLKELEKLGETCESLAEEINELNVELTKISGVKHVIIDLKDWKHSIESTISIDDLKNIKNFYVNNQNTKTSIDGIKDTLKKYEEQIEDYKKFKTKVYAIAGVISFLFATAMTILKMFF